MMWWIIGGVTAIVVVLIPLIVVRASKPRTRQMQQAQDRLNKKNGSQIPIAPVQPDKKGDIWKKAAKAAINVIGILAALGAILLVAWLLWELFRSAWWENPPTLTQVWFAMRKQWFALFLTCGLLYLVGSLVPKVGTQDGKGKREKHQACVILHGLAYAGVATFVTVALAYDVFGEKQPARTSHANVPVVSGDCATQCVITLPPKTSSKPLPIPYRHQPHFDGADALLRCVYTDRSEGTVGDAEKPCHDGPMAYVYLTNTASDWNTLLYRPILSR